MKKEMNYRMISKLPSTPAVISGTVRAALLHPIPGVSPSVVKVALLHRTPNVSPDIMKATHKWV